MNPRKKWEAKTEVTPALLDLRAKRKWQIALRRYVLEKNPSAYYASYFGLDIENLRAWFECQFHEGMSWDNFGKVWQFDHVVPLMHFDFSNEADLKLCWHFTNIRPRKVHKEKAQREITDPLLAMRYFRTLYQKTNYSRFGEMLERLNRLHLSTGSPYDSQQNFILEHLDHLRHIDKYSQAEFELLNSGQSVTEVDKQIEFLRQFAD